MQRHHIEIFVVVDGGCLWRAHPHEDSQALLGSIWVRLTHRLSGTGDGAACPSPFDERGGCALRLPGTSSEIGTYPLTTPSGMRRATFLASPTFSTMSTM